MADIKEKIQDIIEQQIRPKIRVDGGDIAFKKLQNNKLFLDAGAECATCPATAGCLKWWIENELERLTGQKFEVVINKKLPYFKQKIV